MPSHSAETPVALGYATPPSPRRYRRALLPLHIGGYLLLLAFGTWAGVILRGMGPGSAVPALLIITTIVAAAPGSAVLLGVPWRRYAVLVASLAVIPAVVADGYCTIEERVFVAGAKQLPPTSPTVFKDRWWPNENSYLYYDPATGQLGGGD